MRRRLLQDDAFKPGQQGAAQYDFFATAGAELGGLEEGELGGLEGGLEVGDCFFTSILINTSVVLLSKAT